MTPQEVYNQRSPDISHFLPYLRSVARGNILEIGVRGGSSTSAFLLSPNTEHLYSVDINPDCGNLFHHPRWTFIHSDSKNTDVVYPHLTSPLDILFVDGDHTREGYLADLHNYGRLVRPGGLIISHDIACEPNQNLEDLGPVRGQGWPSKAIREEFFRFRPECRHEEIPGKYGLGVVYV